MTSRIVRADGTTELTGVKSVTYMEKVNADVDLRPGCVASASIEVVAYGSQSDAPAAGEALTYYQTGNDGVEHLIGTFYAEPSVPSKATYAFTAYDAVSKLDVDFSSWLNANQNNFPMTVYSLVSAACTVAGVTLGSASWPLSTQTVQAIYANGLTCRNILQYAAEIGCRFVRCNASGQVVFDWYSVVSNYRIYPSGGQNETETETYVAYKESGLNYANYTTAALARVAVHPGGEEQVAYIYPDGVTSGNTLHIQNNLLLTGATFAVYTDVARNVYTNMVALGRRRPMSVELFPGENPYRAGQVAFVTDIQGVSFRTAIMSMTVTDASARLESTGNESYSDYTPDVEKAIAQLASDIVRISKLKVDWADIDTAIIQTLEAEGINADEISITGTLHSSDYARTGTYADLGMGIELNAGKTRIATQNFAVTPTGWMYAVQGYVASAKLARGQSYNYATAPASFVDTDGQTSSAYSYDSATNKTTVSANGTLIYTVPLSVSSGAYEINKIWSQLVSGGNNTEDWPTPTGRVYYLSASGVTLNMAEFSSLRYVAEGSTLGQNFTFSQDWLAEASSIRVEIDVADGDVCRFQRHYGVYAAIYYGDTASLAGDSDGVYFGSDGISVGDKVILTPDGHGHFDAVSATGAYLDGGESLTLQFQTTNGAKSYIRALQDSAGSKWGNVLLINPGGNLVLGGGEFALNAYNSNVDSCTGMGENTYLGADSDVYIYANANTIANRVRWLFARNGNATFPGNLTINGSTDVGATLAGKVNKTGDTMTGNLLISSSNITDGVTPSGNAWGRAFGLRDSTGEKYVGVMQALANANGRQGVYIAGYRTVSGSRVSNSIFLAVDASGNPYVSVSDAAAWRSGLGMADWPTLSYDSGWKDLTFSSAFENYGTSSHMRYRRVGNTVELRGVCKPTAEIAAGGSATIGTLPAGYRPSDTVYQLCQGSGKNTWLCTIYSNGNVQFGRYGSNAYEAAGTGIWGTCHVTFLTDNTIPS